MSNADPTTAAELHALVDQWPEEARPISFLRFPGGGRRAQWFDSVGNDVTLENAIGLHIASGIKWLIRNDHSIEITKMTSGRHAVASRSGLWSHSAPTLLIAMHAAILATKGGSK